MGLQGLSGDTHDINANPDFGLMIWRLTDRNVVPDSSVSITFDMRSPAVLYRKLAF